jgi:hypothetical protein
LVSAYQRRANVKGTHFLQNAKASIEAEARARIQEAVFSALQESA